MFKVVPKKVNNSVQNVPMNLPSLSLMMLDGMPHNFTMCLKNSWAVSSAEHNLGVGTNVAYFENQSTITKMASYSLTFWEVCYEVQRHFSKALLAQVTLAFSTLSCWQMRHVLVYCMMSSRIFGQKYPFLLGHMFFATQGVRPIKYNDIPEWASSSVLPFLGRTICFL